MFPRRGLLSLGVLALAGCDASLDKGFDLISGRETNLVVLAKQPVVLTEKPIILSATESMKVLGEWTSLCIVLQDGIPLQPQPTMDGIFKTALGGAKVRVDVVLGDGARVALHEPMQGWSRSGRVLPRDELSACASTGCESRLPIGATIQSVEVSATPKLKVWGIFWQSVRGLDEKPSAPSSPNDVARNSGKRSTCGA